MFELILSYGIFTVVAIIALGWRLAMQALTAVVLLFLVISTFYLTALAFAIDAQDAKNTWLQTVLLGVADVLFWTRLVLHVGIMFVAPLAYIYLRQARAPFIVTTLAGGLLLCSTVVPTRILQDMIQREHILSSDVRGAVEKPLGYYFRTFYATEGTTNPALCGQTARAAYESLTHSIDPIYHAYGYRGDPDNSISYYYANQLMGALSNDVLLEATDCRFASFQLLDGRLERIDWWYRKGVIGFLLGLIAAALKQGFARFLSRQKMDASA